MKRKVKKGSKIVVAEGDRVHLRVVTGIVAKHYITHRGYGTDLRRRPNGISLVLCRDENISWARGWYTRAANALRALVALDTSR